MEPLSSLTAIAGVVTAGVKLSTSLYDLISSIRDAPKDMAEIARGISETAIVMQQIRRILRDRRELFKRRLLRTIDSAVKRINEVQKEVRQLVDRCDGTARLLWVFRKSTVALLLRKIEGHKSTINLVLHLMMLAIQIQEMPRSVWPMLVRDRVKS